MGTNPQTPMSTKRRRPSLPGRGEGATIPPRAAASGSGSSPASLVIGRPWHQVGVRLFNCPLGRSLRILLALLCGMIAALLALAFGASPTLSWVLVIGLGLAASALILLSLIHTVRQEFILPMAELRLWAMRIQRGQYAARLPTHRGLWFASLARDVNALSETLETLSQDMQSEVQRQTEHLARKTHSLEILYDVAASINAFRDLDDLLTRFLHTLKQVTQARAATVRILDDESHMRLVASEGLGAGIAHREHVMDAHRCLCGNAALSGSIRCQTDLSHCERIVEHEFFPNEDLLMLAVPLQYQGTILGVYNLFVAKDKIKLDDDLRNLLTNMGRHLGMAIAKARLDEESQRLRIMEERTHVAHELHDSLAQSLASLRFQVRIMDEFIQREDHQAVIQELEQVENSLDECYRELRGLINHFRAPTQAQGLIPSIEQLVARYRQQTNAMVFFQNELHSARLPAEVEIQVVRIVQEALINAQKHSQAETVRVLLRREPRGRFNVLVEDDGLGIAEHDSPPGPGERVGLKIMQERAERIRGELRIESEPGEGTRVCLTFRLAQDEQPLVHTPSIPPGLLERA